MSTPWRTNLPTTVDIGGKEYAIRTDFRDILDVFAAMNDPDLRDDRERTIAVLVSFYPDIEAIPAELYEEAGERIAWFINGGSVETPRKSPKLMDWEQDFPYIVAPVNRVLGLDVRSVPYDFENNTGGLHWWTFMSAYQEIGDCLFAQIVGIRRKLVRGKKLDKSEQEFYRNNRQLVDFKRKYTEMENDILSMWVK